MAKSKLPTCLVLMLTLLAACNPNPALPSSEPVQNPHTDETTPEPAASFNLTFGGGDRDRGINLIQTRDDGYAIVGYSSSGEADGEDIYLVRLDSQGKMLWARLYGGEGDDNGWDLLERADGGFIILGFTDSFGAGGVDMYLISTDADGEILWERTYGAAGDEFGWSLAPAGDGGYVLCGQSDSFGAGMEDGYLVRVDDTGEEIWSQTFGGPVEDRLFSIDQSGDGGFILTGTTRSFGAGSRDVYLLKTDSSGDLQWMQTFGEARDDVGHAVQGTADQGFIVTGYTRSFETANYDTWLLKTNQDGIAEWQKFFGGPGDDRAIYGEQTTDGGYVFTGYTKSFDASGWDILLVRSDDSGEVIWYQTFGGVADDTGYTVRETRDHGFILTGETYSDGEGGGDMVVLKVDQGGEISR